MGKLINFTKEEIIEYLKVYKNLILGEKYQISLNKKREENKEFIERFNLRTEKIKEILLSLDYKDFCYAVNNETNNPRFQHEVLYVFNKEYSLSEIGEEDLINVDIYIKTNIIEIESKVERLVVVSFHERNKEISYLFRTGRE